MDNYIDLSNTTREEINNHVLNHVELGKKIDDAFYINSDKYEARVFDWVKAANIIKENPDKCYHAGLLEDWGYTSDIIWAYHKPYKHSGVYLSSQWATPVITAADGSYVECWVYAKDRPNWDAETYFPKEAREILGIVDGE